MKTHQIKSLYQSLRSDLPGFEIKGRLLFQSPYAEILKGFCVDDSSHSPTHFYVWAFVLPLYVPTTTLYFNFGQRLGDGAGRRWNCEEVGLIPALSAEMQSAKANFLDHITTPQTLADYLRQFCNTPTPNHLEALAYSYLLAGDHAAADVTFNRLREALDLGIEWHRNIWERAKTIQAADAGAARELLYQWRDDTVQKLGI